MTIDASRTIFTPIPNSTIFASMPAVAPPVGVSVGLVVGLAVGLEVG